MRDIFGYQAPGMARKVSDWLQIPLHVEYHFSPGRFAIDGAMGVESWEAAFGTQVEHLQEVCRLTGVNVFERAGLRVEGNPCSF